MKDHNGNVLTKATKRTMITHNNPDDKVSLKHTAVKYDKGKVDWMILPLHSLERIAEVFKYAEENKYSRFNFAMGDGLAYSRIINSTVRHLFDFAKGEDIDKETGLNHIAHAGANILMLLHYIQNKERYCNDDRKNAVL